MPHFSVEFHLRWFEWVIRGNIDVYNKNASNVWGIILIKNKSEHKNLVNAEIFDKFEKMNRFDNVSLFVKVYILLPTRVVLSDF